MDDEVIISESASRSLMPWFDDARELERWTIAQILHAADEMRLHRELPEAWRHVQPGKRLRDSMYFVETTGSPPEAVLLFDVVPEGVTLKAAWTHRVGTDLTRHARERMGERIEQLEPDPQRLRMWLNATVDRALRTQGLTLEAPSWAASAPLRPGFGWTTRMLAGDEIALLVAAPHHPGGNWKIVTVLSKSTAISAFGRLARRWRRASRRIANRRHHGKPAPVREQATRPPVLGDVSARPPGRSRRPRR